MGISQIVFIFISLLTFNWAYKQYSQIRQTIFLGKNKAIVGDENLRWRNVFLVAFGQKKMFKRWIPAFMHLFIYVAFLLTQVELIEIMVDGFFGVHRFFAQYLGGFYTFLISFIELLSILAFVGTVVFLARRNLLKLPRFHSNEMTSWPRLDANLILILEILLIIGIFSMNAADIQLQKIDPDRYHNTGHLLLSGSLGPLVFDSLGKDMLVFIERTGWWLHLLVVYTFINYIPKSKHLHIFLAFPNVYYANLGPRGKMENMPEIMAEVKSMMGLSTEDNEPISDAEIPEFGAKDIFDLSWKNILDAFSCTECGRCTSVCPAHITGKKLSPRKIMMDIRDRAEEVKDNLNTGSIKFIDPEKRSQETILTKENYNDGHTLFDRIDKEEIRACTTCQACVEACPVLIDPLDPILKLRRYEILTESSGPSDWLPMFNSLESNGSVWQVPEERIAWVEDLKNN